MMLALLMTLDVAPLPVTDLTPMIGFADARNCRLVPQGERIVEAMTRAQAKARPGTTMTRGPTRTTRYPWLGRLSGSWGIVTRVTLTPGGDTDRGAEIRLHPGAVLHGLPVTSVATRFQQPSESDSYTTRTFTFAASPAQVHAMMARLGADVPRAPEYLDIPDAEDAVPGAITIKGKDGRTELACGWGL